MPSRKSVALSAACLALVGGLATLAAAGATTDTGAAVPYPSAQTPKPLDLGALETLSRTPLTVTVALSLQNPDEAEQLLRAVSTPGSPQYRQFLTADQFAARFAPTQASVSKVIASFAKYNLTAERATATTLHVTGLPADMERAFDVSLHSFQVSGHGDAPGYTFHAPVSGATIPAELSGLVSGVVGLDSRPAMQPLNAHVPATLRTQKPAAIPGYTYNPPQDLTVTDFAHLYDVEPLYTKGVSGAGRTIAILSLANFTPSDAYTYWSALGLTVNPNRITVVYVDGGPGAPSDASGSLETTLDTEQSGGIAPGANIIDYLAPNTNQAFIDVFATAIDANIADTISISWGEWEVWENAQFGAVTDPLTGMTVGTLQAVHEQLLRAGIQGESVFTAQGDGGAYEAFHDLQGLGGCAVPYSFFSPYSCSQTLTVGYPGSDTAITSGGGTTLPVILGFCQNAACTPPYYIVTVPTQRVWGWDYLEGFCSTVLGLNKYSCGIFPAGGGGGVSVEFGIPGFQKGRSGTQLSQPNQLYQAGTAFAFDGIPLAYPLPAHFAGRNVPDVSFNADPETGYLVFYTSSSTGFGIEPGWGGTSFVAPQLNGVTSLLDQELGGRLGLLNSALYSAPDTARENAALHPITAGDNWFYSGSNGYNPGAGLGVMDVANFEVYLHGLAP